MVHPSLVHPSLSFLRWERETRCLRTQDWEEDKDYNFESEHHILWDAAVAT